MNAIEKLTLPLRTFGTGVVQQAIRHAAFRDLSDRRFADLHIGAPVLPGRLLSAARSARGGSFQFEQATLEIEFFAAGLARVSWGPAETPLETAIVAQDWPEVEVSWEECAAGGWELCHSGLTVRVEDQGALQWLGASGQILRAEQPPQRYIFAEETVGWVQRASLAPEEHIYGLGEQAGPLNLRGSFHRLWNTDPAGSYSPQTDPLYMPIPVYYSLQSAGGYLIFYQNSYPAVIGFGPAKLGRKQRPLPPYPSSKQPAGLSPLDGDHSLVYFAGGMLRYYLMPGSPAEALERYTRLTGRPGLPPRWSLGYHQSRWGYKTAAEIREIVKGFKDRDLPLDAIHLDIDYMDGYRVFTVDPDRFSDLPGLSAELEQQGVHLVTIVDPGVKQDVDYEVFREGMKRKLFLNLGDGQPAVGQVWPGWAVFPDFSSLEVREWWGVQYEKLTRLGVDGFWHDMNEPSCFAAWGDPSLPVSVRHAFEGRGGTHAEGHNLYALQMNQAAHAALRSLRPERRPWIVSRSGWASQQRFAWNWTGDTESTWQAQRMALETVLGLGMSGIPFSGPDTGGFSGNPSAELYLRAFQTSAFLPFFRTHSASNTNRRECWVYGEPYTSILRRYLYLRRRLMPLIYTLAWEAGRSGAPLVRPLFWLAPQDRGLWDVGDAFLLGDSLLVAPILEPGARSRTVQLPPGRWYDFWGDSVFEGPGQAALPASLEQIPVLVRGGSVLPLDEDGVLALHIYPPAPGETQGGLFPAGRVYSDAGDGYGPWRLDRFSMQAGDDLEIHWAQEGEFPFPYSAIRVVSHGAVPAAAQVDGRPASLEEIRRPFAILRLSGL